jgi:RES domain-containing protein
VIEAWRIVKRRWAATAFDGEGARRFGGRWNAPGRPLVYVSDSRALAVLEVLAGLGSTAILPAWVLIGVRFPSSLVSVLEPADLPDGWDATPPGPPSRAAGDRWLVEAFSSVLRVPSVIVPAEPNYLLNPSHPDFSRVEIGEPEELRLDARLTGRRSV